MLKATESSSAKFVSPQPVFANDDAGKQDDMAQETEDGTKGATLAGIAKKKRSILKRKDKDDEVEDGEQKMSDAEAMNEDDLQHDGAAEEGVVHESLNFARVQNAPVLFVIENNLFASHMHISLRQPSDMVSRFAVANDIPFELVDGNDVVATAQAAKNLITSIRSGRGPRLIELVTYRIYGHVDWREDIDVGVKRSLKDIENWKARDPITRLANAMLAKGIWSKEREDEFNNQLDLEIKKAWDRAMNDPFPELDSTLKYVYEQNDE